MHRLLSWADIGIIIAVAIGSACIVYIPFIFGLLPYLGFSEAKSGMDVMYQNYDGLLYLVPAKTGYLPEAIHNLRLETSLPPIYFAAHLPLYPILISIFAPVIGWLKSMVFVTLISSVGLGAVFLAFVRRFALTKHPLLLTCLLLFFPRLFIVRLIGAPECLFLLLIVSSIWMFEEKKYLLAGLLGGLAAMTKIPGVLLFPAFLIAYFAEHKVHNIFEKKHIGVIFSFLFVLAGLFLVFSYYALVYGDFFAYFHTGGVVPMPYPFSVFHTEAKWVGTAWLEDIMLLFILYLIATVRLAENKLKSMYYFVAVFLGASFFVQHRDLSRYMLPVVPFVCIAFESFLTRKKVIMALCILIPALFLYALNFLAFNILPVSDWRPFL